MSLILFDFVSFFVFCFFSSRSHFIFLFFPVAELGDYSETEHPPGYLSDFSFIPIPPQDFHKEVSKYHQQHRYAWTCTVTLKLIKQNLKKKKKTCAWKEKQSSKTFFNMHLVECCQKVEIKESTSKMYCFASLSINLCFIFAFFPFSFYNSNITLISMVILLPYLRPHRSLLPSLSGLSPAQAEFNYLNTARTLELYGVELHYAKVSKV